MFEISLPNLPGELLMEIADILSESDLNSLVRSSRRLHYVLDHFLYGKRLARFDRTGLYWATEHDQLEAVKKFMEIGVKFMTYKHQLFYTPLLSAAERGYLEMVAFLLEFGGTAHLKHQDHCDAMTLAIERGHTEVVELFLGHGFDPESELDWLGRRPLHVAAEKGNDKLVRLFLSRGVDQRLTDHTGSSALHRAVKNGHETCTALLIRGHEDLLFQRGNCQTPLESVIFTEEVAVVKTLFQNGADLSSANITDFSPLFVAALFGRLQMVELLLDQGLDVNGLDLNGQMPPTQRIEEYLNTFRPRWESLPHTNLPVLNLISAPICAAAAMGHTSIVKALLDHGADANRIDQYGNLPLNLGAECGRREVVSLLVASGTNVNAIGHSGRSALSWAIDNDSEIACDLLRAGASVYLGDQNLILEIFPEILMPSTYIIPSTQPHHDRVRCLWGCCDNDDRGVQARDNLIDCFLQCGADINSSDRQGKTLLHQAAFFLSGSTVQLLLDRGADPSPVDIYGQTPLHIALDWFPESPEVIRLLLKFGANVNAQDIEGYTPLHMAVLMGYVPIVEALLEDGRANVGSRSKNGETPMDLVPVSHTESQSERLEMVRVLCDHGADPDCIARTSWALEEMELDEPSSSQPEELVW